MNVMVPAAVVFCLCLAVPTGLLALQGEGETCISTEIIQVDKSANKAAIVSTQISQMPLSGVLALLKAARLMALSYTH